MVAIWSRTKSANHGVLRGGGMMESSEMFRDAIAEMKRMVARARFHGFVAGCLVGCLASVVLVNI